jgi:hypothetical protein
MQTIGPTHGDVNVLAASAAFATVTASEQKQHFRRTTSSAIVDSFSPGHDERYSCANCQHGHCGFSHEHLIRGAFAAALKEATVILETWSTMLRQTGNYIGPSGFWSQSQNRRWVLTLSLSATATYTTESTSALAKSCIRGASRERCAADRWKRLLSLVCDRTLRASRIRCTTEIRHARGGPPGRAGGTPPNCPARSSNEMPS